MVTDLNGKIIMKKQATIQNGVNLFPISLQGFANGNYIVVVDVKGETQTLVFTKE
jgi:hypothetical protein